MRLIGPTLNAKVCFKQWSSGAKQHSIYHLQVCGLQEYHQQGTKQNLDNPNQGGDIGLVWITMGSGDWKMFAINLYCGQIQQNLDYPNQGGDILILIKLL